VPFDILEAESELVAGFRVEYSGMKFALIQLAEYAHMLGTSFLGALLFLGGWLGPGPAALGRVVRAQALLIFLVVTWVRWSFVRIRCRSDPGDLVEAPACRPRSCSCWRPGSWSPCEAPVAHNGGRPAPGFWSETGQLVTAVSRAMGVTPAQPLPQAGDGPVPGRPAAVPRPLSAASSRSSTRKTPAKSVHRLSSLRVHLPAQVIKSRC